jgi:hypothetical protein
MFKVFSPSDKLLRHFLSVQRRKILFHFSAFIAYHFHAKNNIILPYKKGLLAGHIKERGLTYGVT